MFYQRFHQHHNCEDCVHRRLLQQAIQLLQQGQQCCRNVPARSQRTNKTNFTKQEESDMVKLGRQMRLSYKRLVLNGVPSPVVCGVLCHGHSLSTLVLDVAAPLIYRLVKLDKVEVFKNLRQLHNILAIFYTLNHLRNIAVHTLNIADEAIVQAAEQLQKRPYPPIPLSLGYLVTNIHWQDDASPMLEDILMIAKGCPVIKRS
ncbi:hypothetical protein MBANPS3_010538 [Mucor bainieri]